EDEVQADEELLARGQPGDRVAQALERARRRGSLLGSGGRVDRARQAAALVVGVGIRGDRRLPAEAPQVVERLARRADADEGRERGLVPALVHLEAPAVAIEEGEQHALREVLELLGEKGGVARAEHRRDRIADERAVLRDEL